MIQNVGNRMTREAARQARLAQTIERVQTEISSGTKLQKASDDPVAAAKVAQIDRARSNTAAWQHNIAASATLVAEADSALGTATSLVARARELLLAASSDTSNAASRQSAAAEIDAIAAEVAGLSDARAPNGEQLFASGAAARVRFGPDSAFAPVPARDAAFSIGGTSITSWLTDAATAARQGDRAAMTAGLTNLDAAIGKLSDERAGLGMTGARLDRLTDALSERDIGLASERSVLADTDLSQAIAQLNAQQLTLEAAQAAFARINRQTLFDYLR